MVRFRETNLMTLTSVGRSAHVSVPWPIARGEAPPGSGDERARRCDEFTHSTRASSHNLYSRVMASLTEKISPLLNEARAKFHGSSIGSDRGTYIDQTRSRLRTETRRQNFTSHNHQSVNNNNYLCVVMSVRSGIPGRCSVIRRRNESRACAVVRTLADAV